MKLNIKSRKGFTLIELLVVIGILAVLVAIAIPSVAGLIDRANVSSDKTNSNEMTNAVERFASEYELYCQDIASGVIKESTTDFDSVQGRVYNVTGVKTRAGIEKLEIAQDETVDGNTIAIYRDTKYPVNAETMKKVVENYTKTSSSTFEPKQSDMHYWYSPDCGVVVFAEPDADQDKENKLNIQIQSGIDAKGNPVGPNTKWIDLTLGISTNNGTNDDANNETPNVITAGATFADGTTLTWEQLFLEENKSKYGYDIDIQGTILTGNFFDVEIVKIVIAEGITSIDECPFDGCLTLTDITLPSTINYIGDCAFDNSVETIKFNGTTEQFTNVSFGIDDNLQDTLFICINGNLTKCNECFTLNNPTFTKCTNCQSCVSCIPCTHPNICDHVWCYHTNAIKQGLETCQECGWDGLDEKACLKCHQGCEYGWYCDVCDSIDESGNMPNVCINCGKEVRD